MKPILRNAWRRRTSILVAIGLTSVLAVPVSAGFDVLLQIFRNPGTPGLKGAQGVTASPEGGYVYVASGKDNALTFFRRDATAESLSFAGVFKDGANGVFGLRGASQVAVSPDLQHVYVASRRDSSLVVFRRDATADTLTFADVKQNGVGGVFGLAGATDVVVSPDARHVAVVGRKDDALALFRRNPGSDFLTPVDLEMGGFGLASPTAVTMDPSGRNAYVAAFEDNAISVFSRDASLDSLAISSVVADGIGGINGLKGASDIAISPDGRNAYVASFVDGTLSVFKRNLLSGALTIFQQIQGGGALAGAKAVAVSPDGATVVVATRKGLLCFDRVAEGGLIPSGNIGGDFMGGGNARVSEIAFSNDNKNLFVVSRGANALLNLGVSATVLSPGGGPQDGGDAKGDGADDGDVTVGDGDGTGQGLSSDASGALDVSGVGRRGGR
ncbi:MAG: beta-propeller fold lactonase family protein [Acidobacteriota bacterium]